jgi:hypothetical protein
MLSSPLGTIGWLATRSLGGSPEAQEAALQLGVGLEGLGMAAAGLRGQAPVFAGAQPESFTSGRVSSASNRVRYSSGLLDKSFDPLPVDQAVLNQFVRNDPALSNVRLSAQPTLTFDLRDGTVGRSRLIYDSETNTYTKVSEIGPGAFRNRSELVGTIVHEEVHLRFGDKLERGSERFLKLDAMGLEEAYVRGVENRYLLMQQKAGR